MKKQQNEIYYQSARLDVVVLIFNVSVIKMTQCAMEEREKSYNKSYEQRSGY